MAMQIFEASTLKKSMRYSVIAPRTALFKVFPFRDGIKRSVIKQAILGTLAHYVQVIQQLLQRYISAIQATY